MHFIPAQAEHIIWEQQSEMLNETIRFFSDVHLEFRLENWNLFECIFKLRYVNSQVTFKTGANKISHFILHVSHVLCSWYRRSHTLLACLSPVVPSLLLRFELTFHCLTTFCYSYIKLLGILLCLALPFHSQWTGAQLKCEKWVLKWYAYGDQSWRDYERECVCVCVCLYDNTRSGWYGAKNT